MTNPTPRPRSVIEAEIRAAELDLAFAQDQLADATDRVRDLEDELAKLDNLEATGSVIPPDQESGP
jgi:phage shock protein A